MITTLALSILLLFKIAPSFAEQNSNQKSFFDKAEGVAFNFPDSWSIQQQKTNAFLVMIGSLSGMGESCMLQTNRNPTLRQISSENFVESIKQQDIVDLFKRSHADVTIIAFRRTKVGNRPAIFYEAHSTYKSLTSQFPIRLMTVMLKVDERMYSMGCTAHAESIETVRPTFMKILNSLTVRF